MPWHGHYSVVNNSRGHIIMTKKIIPAAVTAAAVGLVAGCTTVVREPAAPTKNSAPAGSAPSSPSPASSSGPIGTSTFQITDPNAGPSGDQTAVYTVTALKILDPAAPDNSFDSAPSGHHLVGVEFQIKGISENEQDDADSDAAVTGNDQQTYQAGFEGLAAGTNFNSGDFNTSPGTSTVGWVSFEVKDGVTVTAVQWTPNGGINGGPATWTVTG